MELPSYFTTFMTAIRPTDNQQQDLRTGHKTLRDRLNADPDLKPILVSDFLQGSYRRATAIRPKGDKRSDVDIIVVTRLSANEYEPDEAMDVFVPFLDRHYKGKWVRNGRSFGIELSYVDLDLVITAAPSQSEEGILKSFSVTTDETPEDTDDWRLVKSWIPVSERDSLLARFTMEKAKVEPEWKTEPLLIPDREAKRWDPTDPLAQIKWTWEKNEATNEHYVNVVKAIKWWRRVHGTTPKYPKGYPVEHLVGQSCPDGISSVAAGVTRALEDIASRYAVYAALKIVPNLPDHGVPDHNVFGRVSGEDFAAFHAQVCEAAKTARRALDADTPRASSEAWRELFGDKFPLAPEEKSGGGYSRSRGDQLVGGGRFA